MMLLMEVALTEAWIAPGDGAIYPSSSPKVPLAIVALTVKANNTAV